MACAHVFLDPFALARVDLFQPVYLAPATHPDFSRKSWPKFATPESYFDCKFVLDDIVHSFCHFLLFSLCSHREAWNASEREITPADCATRCEKAGDVRSY